MISAFLRLGNIPPYLLVVAGYAGQTFAMGGFAFWAPTFLQRAHGMSLAAADHFFGLALVVTGLIATLLGGMAATAWQKRDPAGYSKVLALSAAATVPAAFGAFLVPDLAWAKAALVAAMFLIFLGTGPINTLIVETVPVAMRATAMAGSIFAIHLLGDFWSPKIVGALSDRLGDLQRAILWTLPSSLAVCAIFWFWLAARQSTPPPSPPNPPRPLPRFGA
jgi:MFS transporter, Spinster family, sphingosine-1-phosphate transporter